MYLLFCFQMLCSCASFWGHVLEKPKVDLDHVSVKDVSLKGSTLVFHVSVENPNKMDLQVEQVRYKVFLNGKELSHAQTEKPVTVPGKSTALVELPLPVEYSKIFLDLKELMFAESASYKIEGDAKFSLFSIPFTKEGNIKLR